MKKYIEQMLIENWERFFWIFIGGWIQLILSKRNGVKFSKFGIIGTLLISAYIGYWAGELCEILDKPELANFISSLSAIGSHSILNFYSNNISKILKALLKGKLNINIEENKEENGN